MKRRLTALPLAVFLFLSIAAAGCGSMYSNSSGSGGGQTVPISFTMSDTPPVGVTILRFQIQVTAASLQPNMGQPVPMLTAPVEVELEHLQSEPALLANLSVPAGTYNSLSVTFANPQMTIFNESNTTYTVGAQNCAPKQLCMLTPPLNQTMVSDQSAPFPITLSSNSPLEFLLHFDVNASVQGDLSISPMISLKEVPPMTGIFERFHVIGRITTISSGNSSFTLRTGFGNISLNVATNANTQYDFGSVCSTEAFSCLMVGQVVRVKLNVMTGGALVAAQIELLGVPKQPVLEGTVIGVNAAQNQIKLALIDFQDDDQGDFARAAMTFGISLTVQVSSSTAFSIDTDGVTLPSGVSFGGIQDVIVGQELAIQPIFTSIAVSGTAPAIQITLSTNSVCLEPSELTATVATVNAQATPPNFPVNALPPLFTSATPASIMEIQVDVVPGTDFENISGISQLTAGEVVSVGGLLFNTSTTPTLVAERVLVRD
jgi:Domain of unknown function (DUF5666)/Domain of unknown function (DUF4382)